MAKSETKTNLGKLGLGRNAVFVSLLPTGTTAIVVSYSPNVILSCAVMPNEFDIEYSVVGVAKKDRLRVKTPHLFMGLAYNDVPFSTYPSVKNQCNLWALNIDRTDGIYVKPYRLANVWETGGVCFGNLAPVSLRQAFNYYWTSLFNDDIPVPHICKNKKHSYEWHNGCLCDESAKNHECDCLKVTFHKHAGCGCITVKKSIKCSKNKKCLNASQCICCLAIEKLHKQNPKEKRKAVALRVLAPGETFPYCGCSWRHLRHCPCKKNKCLCKCECLCCNKKCNHQECECSCCRNTCACPCKCSKKQRLLQQFTSYNEDIFNFGRWENATKLVCGDKYWASPKGAEGVLISRNRALLNVIPRKFWRSSKIFGPMVIALANRNSRGWYFESGSFTFYIDYKNVANR